MVDLLFLLMMAYAAVGLILSLAVHVGVSSGDTLFFLHFTLEFFPLWAPVVILMQRAVGNMRADVGRSWSPRSNPYWKMLFTGCPPWLKYATEIFYYYALINFVIVFLTAIIGQGQATPSAVARGFSGHWMLFYSVGLAVATTAYRRGISSVRPVCSNGHPVGWGDKYCGVCGSRLESDIEDGSS